MTSGRSNAQSPQKRQPSNRGRNAANEIVAVEVAVSRTSEMKRYRLRPHRSVNAVSWPKRLGRDPVKAFVCKILEKKVKKNQRSSAKCWAAVGAQSTTRSDSFGLQGSQQRELAHAVRERPKEKVVVQVTAHNKARVSQYQGTNTPTVASFDVQGRERCQLGNCARNRAGQTQLVENPGKEIISPSQQCAQSQTEQRRRSRCRQFLRRCTAGSRRNTCSHSRHNLRFEIR